MSFLVLSFNKFWVMLSVWDRCDKPKHSKHGFYLLLLGWVHLGWLPDPTQSLTPPLEQHTRHNKMEQLLGWEKEKSLSLAKLTRLGTKTKCLFYCQLKRDQDSEKQRQNPPTLCLLPRASFSSSLTTPLLSPLQVVQGKGNGGLWSAHSSSSLLLLSSHTFPCSSMNSPLAAGKSTLFHRIAFYFQVWTWNIVSADTCSQCKRLINWVMQLWGQIKDAFWGSDPYRRWLLVPAQAEHAGSVAAGIYTRCSATDAHHLAWSQRWAGLSWACCSLTGVQALNQHISLGFLNLAFLPTSLFSVL